MQRCPYLHEMKERLLSQPSHADQLSDPGDMDQPPSHPPPPPPTATDPTAKAPLAEADPSPISPKTNLHQPMASPPPVATVGTVVKVTNFITLLL